MFDSTECIWSIANANNPNYTRVTSLLRRDENEELVLRQLEELEALDGATVETRFGPCLIDNKVCMNDGKLHNLILGNHSSQTCPFCTSTPSQFHDGFQVCKSRTNMNSLIYGISPLHLLIKVMCALIRFQIKKSNPAGQQTFQAVDKQNEDRKFQLILEALTKISDTLTIDGLSKGNGPGIPGNCARNFFFKYGHEVLQVLDKIHAEVFDKIVALLIAISCDYKLNIIEFDKVYAEVYEWWVSNLKKVYMPGHIRQF